MYNRYRHGMGNNENMHGMNNGCGHMHGMESRRGFGLKYWILTIASESKVTGSEITEKIAKITDGRWVPSPGIIYPMLKNLYDLKYLEMEERDGKKYYYITDSGREFLNNSWFPWKKQVEFGLKGNENSVVLDKIENNIQYLADNRDRLTSDEKLRLEKIKNNIEKILF